MKTVVPAAGPDPSAPGTAVDAAPAAPAGAPPRRPEARASALVRLLVMQQRLGLGDDDLAREVADRISLRHAVGLALDAQAPSGDELRGFRAALLATEEGRSLLASAAVGEGVAGAEIVDRPLLSVVIPVYHGEGVLDELLAAVVTAASAITPRFEVVLVEDGSPDGGWQRILDHCRRDFRIKGVKLSRNFGQQPAITAGLDRAAGDWIAVMDCDLQDDPAFLAAMFHKAQEGYDIVFAVKRERRYGLARNLAARTYFALINWLTPGSPADGRVGAFSLISRRAALAFRRLGDVHRHYIGLLQWLGFPTAKLTVEHRARPAGRSSYTLAKLLRHAVDGVVQRTDRLLHLVLGVSALFLAGAMLAAAYLLVNYYRHGYLAGWTSTILLVLTATSTILFSLGIHGIYVAKIFDQVRQRPLYLIEETRNLGPAGSHGAQGDESGTGR